MTRWLLLTVVTATSLLSDGFALTDLDLVNVTEIQELLDHMETHCLDAQTEAEVGEFRSKLQDLKLSPALEEGLGRRRDTAIEFAEAWQKYIAYEKMGNLREADRVLSDLLTSSNWLSLVPRSRVLERKQALRAPRKLLPPPRTLDELPAIISELGKENGRIEDFIQRESSADRFSDLQSLWNRQSGRAVERLTVACAPHEWDSVSLRTIKLLILPHVLAEFLQLDVVYHRSPQPDETAPAYLRTLIKQATQENDLAALWRAQCYLAELEKDRSSWGRADLEALGYVLEGQRQEQNGRAAAAVACYRSALCYPADQVIRDRAAERLKALQKENPSAYEEGVKLCPLFDKNKRLRMPGLPFDPGHTRPLFDRELWKAY